MGTFSLVRIILAIEQRSPEGLLKVPACVQARACVRVCARGRACMCTFACVNAYDKDETLRLGRELFV